MGVVAGGGGMGGVKVVKSKSVCTPAQHNNVATCPLAVYSCRVENGGLTVRPSVRLSGRDPIRQTNAPNLMNIQRICIT